MVKKKPTAETLTESKIGRLIQAYGWPRHHPHRGVKNNCQRMPPVFHHVRPINSWHEGPPPPRREIESPARWTLPEKKFRQKSSRAGNSGAPHALAERRRPNTYQRRP